MLKGPSTTRSGAPVPLLEPPAIHAAQHERAGRAESRGARPALPLVCPCRSSPAATAILHGLARRTAPQTESIATRSRASRWVVQENGPDRSRGQLSHNHWEVNHDQINTITHHVLVNAII